MPHARQSNRPDPSFVSVVFWEGDASPKGAARHIAAASGLDEPSLALALRRTAPAIVAETDGSRAAAAVGAIRDLGGEALAPTLTDIASAGAPIVVRELRVEPGAFDVEARSGPRTRIDVKNLQSIVRGSVKTTQRATLDEIHDAARRAAHVHARRHVTSAATGAHRAAKDAAARGGRVSHRHFIDLHTHNGLVFQIDGDRFAWSALGDLRGGADGVNAAKMCELLTHLAPHAILDECFARWNPPASTSRLRLDGVDAAYRDFAFYSRWIARIHRSLVQGPEASGAG